MNLSYRYQLLSACNEGNISKVCSIVDQINLLDLQDILIGIKNQRGTNCLYLACKKGHLNIVHYLFNKFTSRSTRPLDFIHGSKYIVTNSTPLHVAAKNGHLEIIICMLNFLESDGMDLLFNRTIHGETALHLAVENNHLKVVEYL